MKLSTRIPSSTQLRTHEAAWIKACHPNWGMVLMELAGKQAASVVMALWEQSPGNVAIFCGTGNNGGDGLGVARYLHLSGIPVTVLMVKGSSNKSDDQSESKINKKIVENLGIHIEIIEKADSDVIASALSQASIIVDALLGTGLDRPVEGTYKQLIELINETFKPVIAIDIPSGVNSDTGQIMGVAIQAIATVTIGYLKAGLLCHPGADLCGHLTLVDIGLPDFQSTDTSNQARWWLATTTSIRDMLPDRPADANKGSFGTLLTIAGSLGMSGASVLASKSALRAGAGLSWLATPKSVIPHLPPQEIIYHALPETDKGTIHVKAIDVLKEELQKASAIVFGPGISTDESTVQLVQKLLQIIKIPCTLDADALNAIAKDTSIFPEHGNNFVMTPHPKELSRLMGISVQDIQANRIEIAQKAAVKFGCTVVLKGSRTIIATSDLQIVVNPTGNAGMATAGSGDVLSGIIGGLLAQGLTPFTAATAGVYIHGAAGDLAAKEFGETGIIASDIMKHIPTAIEKISSSEYRSPLEQQVYG